MIRFQAATKSLVRLEILDILGRSVKVLTDEQKNAGSHSVNWDGKDERGQSVNAGVYLVRLKAAERIMVKKIILMR